MPCCPQVVHTHLWAGNKAWGGPKWAGGVLCHCGMRSMGAGEGPHGANNIATIWPSNNEPPAKELVHPVWWSTMVAPHLGVASL